MNDAVWRQVNGYEGLYEVSDTARVRSVDRIVYRNNIAVKLSGIELKVRVSVRGYLEVKLSKDGKTKTETVHKLVATAFLKRLPHHTGVNHIDGNKLNSYVYNVEWTTQKENTHHALVTGLLKRVPEQYDNMRLKVINTKTGEVFESLKVLCDRTGLVFNTMRSYLTGHRKNKTSFQYLKK